MTELVVFPDAEAIIGGYLGDNLAVPVVTRVARERPASFVLVRRIGGVLMHIVGDEPMLSVESWAATDEAAHDLSQLARAWLHAAAGMVLDGTTVYRVTEVSGPARLPDPTSDVPRFVFTALIGLRGDVQQTAS